MTLEIHSPQQSVNERRGQRLAPLQTNFSRPTARPIQVTASRPQRPRPSDYQTDEEGGERVPLQPAPVKRQTSKSSLRNIFGRDKSARKPAPDVKLSGIDEQKPAIEQPAPNAGSASLSPTLVATPRTNASAATLPTSPTTVASQRSRLPAKSRGKSSDEQPPAGDLGWKPPPLFQAYPQSIKHDSLPVPALSVESILRMQATAKAKGIVSRDDNPSSKSSQNGDATEDSTKKKKEEKERKRHLRTLSETINKTEWSQKVFVLATAGYILQYAGSGKHDRLPEKMLQLGPKSVAFASDAIPGKHYVLQVTQSSEEEGIESTKPRFRFGFHRSHARRMERTFLLVFDHPEDMNTWLLAVRAQIEARGGKKYISERTDDEPGHQLHNKPSVRQMITKDTKRYSTLIPPPLPAGEERESSLSDQSRRDSYVSINHRSIVLPPASESRSGSISTTHTEVTSPASNSGRFYSMAASSVPSMPSADHVPTSSDVASPTSSTSTKRRSMHASPTQAMPTAAEMAAEIPRAQSTQPDQIYRSTSPPAPNFSVPSFSKRFTARFGPLQVPQFAQTPPALEVVNNDSSVDTLSAFPSPPHSPGKIPNGLVHEMHEPQPARPVHGLAPPKPLRVSSSQDSLVDPTARGGESKAHRLSRLPRDPLQSAANTVRPTTAVGGKPPSDLHLLAEEPPNRHEPPRARGSVMYPNDPNARLPPAGMGRRKSMPGLIGPPAAPPPNCPLPKIPSPIDPQPDGWCESPMDPGQFMVPLQPIHEQRKSLAPGPYGSSGRRSVSRQSRIAP
ncbi:peptidase family M20/M25/M40 protein [Aspergillus saccharolyticus JOP 1030-1]|uniref:Peptidase family M20/M25/M40 protein n=1 Tax=Aspergillus saccharolyticus JOP 1030-1 TaxID=1450539 RepID=A0A318Z9W3_9EURO|nr:peptidase family M20/M25/M40 protein [Aspergillus saccharolyticus JOP 1030-1]PYH44201.1 peptidase family M20/M25/M40 protein [Aspergillus saccharolyticus JOP 1030-1]